MFNILAEGNEAGNKMGLKIYISLQTSTGIIARRSHKIEASWRGLAGR